MNNSGGIPPEKLLKPRSLITFMKAQMATNKHNKRTGTIMATLEETLSQKANRKIRVNYFEDFFEFSFNYNIYFLNIPNIRTITSYPLEQRANLTEVLSFNSKLSIYIQYNLTIKGNSNNDTKFGSDENCVGNASVKLNEEL